MVAQQRAGVPCVPVHFAYKALSNASIGSTEASASVLDYE